MLHRVIGQASFYALLLRIDEELAEEIRQAGCTCGGPRHRANYPRSPRGTPVCVPEGYGLRLSFCCGREGCRKRATPPSVRFLGRRWYLGGVVVVACVLANGATPWRLGVLEELLEGPIPRRTLARWRRWWREVFPETAFWAQARARFARPVAVERLPESLAERFERVPGEDPPLVRMLRFLWPLTTSLPRTAMEAPRR
jgi:hypothetical protein